MTPPPRTLPPGSAPRRAPRRAARALATVLALATLGACTSVEGTGDKGYVTGDGEVRVLDPAQREEPVDLTGTDLAGQDVDLADLRGKPVVLPVWGSWCVPCRAEAPDVVAAAEELEGTASFVGINIRDTEGGAQAFQREFGVPYPSIVDDGLALLAFTGTLTPYTVPAFVVLDEQGRVGASILGELPSTQTLVDLVDEVTGG
ncbi:TlpA family protein disulfide reductase [Nocardioides marmotae]|uniref:TlpA family protein disulfide reductase n=1 Tax=Nocardioides marmotae TaxID=2663857 RepID=UPI0012B5FFB2|nr:TlpA disulfide reductase family protein [Nocardioides marmotae]MBC9732972.1 TlpA family protein disulfide reductase [Nocardioides marmotae]MTB84086.1 redoxin domain-containing protein [Nocardioides marmotae]